MASTSTAYPELSHLPPIPHLEQAAPSTSVLDAFRIAIATQITSALPTLTVEQVFEGVHYGQKGHDFTVAMPRFRLKEKVDIICKTVVDSVRMSIFLNIAPRLPENPV
jgi:arginyl-tRNA synthetase